MSPANPPLWAQTLRLLAPRFMEASTSRGDLQLVLTRVADEEMVEIVKMNAVCLHRFHGRERVCIVRCGAEGIAVLHGANEAVDRFNTLAFEAGAHLPRDLFPGLRPKHFSIGWICFVLQQLRGHPGQLLLVRCDEEHRPYDEVMNDPFAASAVAIEMVAAAPTPPGPDACKPLHGSECAILRVMAAAYPEALIQAEIGQRTTPRMADKTVSRWLRGLRKRGFTAPMTSGGESLTPAGREAAGVL